MTTMGRGLVYGLMNLLLIVGLLGCSTSQSERADINARAKTALDNLYRQTPAARSLAQNSTGVLVFPDITQAGLGIGGQYGTGVLFKGGKPAGHYNVAGGSIGLQIGAETFSEAYFFTTPEALKTFEETKGFEVGAGLDFAVADVGTSGDISSSTLQKPLVIFLWGQHGLMAGVKVEGQKITQLAASE
jgi:lipid-binding SYLF domain-containing protein